jgi:hypothetical protein
MRKFMTSRFRAVAIAACTLLAAACSNTFEPADYNSTLYIANATNGAFAFTIDGLKRQVSLPVNEVSIAQQLAPGTHQIQLTDALGASTELTVTTSAEAPRTIVAYPRSTSGSSAGITTAVFADTGALVPPGKSKLRVAHLAANAGNIEIWRSQPDFRTGSRIMTPFAYQATSPYLESDPGVWEVWLTSSNSSAKTLSTGPIEIPSGQRRTVLLLDSAGGPRFVVIAE